ncbi:glycosyl transferase [Rubrivivax gelatinosus]|nr:glycosyl transferase [Rubrivivax gelatinosus]
MPCHNAYAHLPGSVGSLVSQTLPDWELVAVNDGSSDDTLAWLRAQTDPRIGVVDQANAGVSAARNAGLARCRGRFIAFLDADDSWSPDFLQRMVQALTRRPDAVLAYCGWQNVGLPGPRGQPYLPPDYESGDKVESVFGGCPWPVHAAMVRREAVLAAGGFDTTLQNAEDYALWLKLALSGPLVRVPEVLAHYHFHGGVQASRQRARAALQFLRAQRAGLAGDPRIAAQLGPGAVRRLTFGTLLQRGYESYWEGDLEAARPLFRVVMSGGYGGLRDWKYMLPSWLPLALHRALLGARRGASAAARQDGDLR